VTPTATDEGSGFATPSNTPSSTTVQIPSATPGPQMETPFGAAHTYLIHKVNAGESLPVLAGRYGTSPEAIKKINRLETATILHPDQILIVMPGVINDWEAEPLLAVFLEEDIEIETIASQYGVTVEEAREYNALGQEITILGGRWLVFPFHNITPTPTTVPLDTPEQNGTLTKPFGPENSYTIHQVRAGESIGSLERIYNTSAAVIQQINGIEGSIQENQILVILLNQVDAAGLTPLRAILIENETSINELASQLFVLPSEIIYWNDLTEGELIPADQWIIYPD
jgi:LysM repeat protein